MRMEANKLPIASIELKKLVGSDRNRRKQKKEIGCLQFAPGASCTIVNMLLFIYSPIRNTVFPSESSPYQCVFVGFYFRNVAIFSVKTVHVYVLILS